MKKLIALGLAVATLLLTGCAAPKLVHGYEGEPKPVGEVAVLLGKDNFHYRLAFANVADLDVEGDLEWIETGNAWTGYTREVRVLPGRYVVMTHCTIGNRYAFPSIRVTVVAGMTYEMTCGETSSTSNSAEVSVNERPTTAE